MATISGAAQRREPRSGGKMVRPRRATLLRTPYDRPALPDSTHQNPNWISRRIFSPTRTIVSGAGRILSTVFSDVFGFDSSSSSSSDLESSADDAHDNNDDQDVSSQWVHTIEHRETQSFAGNNETKCLIEQLLLQETFSREECDKLVNILKSRVVDSPMIRGMGVGRLTETPNKAGGSDVEDRELCSAAVMEARKWLEEKKSASNSKSDFHQGTSALNSVTVTHHAEGESGSPVDMAKSYMRTRPPWASPSSNNIEFRSPSPIGMPLLKEETPYSIGDNSLSLWKRKRDSPATGSWNIQEEIRKVRSKATEEMLRTLSSSEIDWSSFASERKRDPDTSVVNNLGAAEECNPQSSKKSVTSADLAARPVSPIMQDALHIDAVQSPPTLVCEQNQGMGAIESIDGIGDETSDLGQRLQSTVDMKTTSNSDYVAANVDHLKDTKGSFTLFSSTTGGAVQDSQVEDKDCSPLKEFDGKGGALSTANGFPSSGSSMSAEIDKELNHRTINEEDNAIGSGHDNETGMAAEENCELLSEASFEVPMANETDAVAAGSQNSYSMQDQGSPRHLNIPNIKRAGADKSNSGIERQQGQKVSRYNRRGRGRGR